MKHFPFTKACEGVFQVCFLLSSLNRNSLNLRMRWKLRRRNCRCRWSFWSCRGNSWSLRQKTTLTRVSGQTSFHVLYVQHVWLLKQDQSFKTLESKPENGITYTYILMQQFREEDFFFFGNNRKDKTEHRKHTFAFVVLWKGK